MDSINLRLCSSSEVAFSYWRLSAVRRWLCLTATHSLDIVEVYLDLVPHAICDFLQLDHVLQLGLGARVGGVLFVIDHVILVVVVIAGKVEPLELVCSFGRGGFVVFEKVNKGSCVLLSAGGMVLSARAVYKPSCSL